MNEKPPMERERLRKTDIMCSNCEETTLVVVPGWETKEALVCPNCENYHYFVGFIYCSGNASAPPISDEYRQRLREALGGDFSLKPEIQEKVRGMLEAIE